MKQKDEREYEKLVRKFYRMKAEKEILLLRVKKNSERLLELMEGK